MSVNIISIKALYKEYRNYQTNGSLVALNHVDLEIPEGSFFGLLGPNGAGKSTIINILAGITNKTSGSCMVNGYDLDIDPIKVKLSLGIVPQEIVCDPFFTVRQTLNNYAGYFGVSKNRRKTDEIINALDLTDKADAPSRSLSGGMKRRLLIAKALVHQPKILILDEPTAGVDIELREQLWQYVLKLNQDGTTIILTTHYIEEAEKLCEYIAIINHGSIIANDKKEDLLVLFREKILTIEFDGFQSHVIDMEYLERLGGQIKENKLIIKYTDKKYLDELIKYIVATHLIVTNITSTETKLEDVLKGLIRKDKVEI